MLRDHLMSFVLFLSFSLFALSGYTLSVLVTFCLVDLPSRDILECYEGEDDCH
ncbi:unnamed protein product [Amoebophrya sp. A25]|nr:unnamed protein product [Amoebophrya sp. A25]|eukprot:GSA25T00022111001.1